MMRPLSNKTIERKIGYEEDLDGKYFIGSGIYPDVK